MLFQLLATTSRAADLTSLYGSFIFSSKKLAKKTPKIKEVYTGSHAGCRQEWVPEGTKSQICIRIIYFLHAFRAMTPPPRVTRHVRATRRYNHTHVHSHRTHRTHRTPTVVAHVAWTLKEKYAVTGDSQQPCLCLWRQREGEAPEIR